MEIVDFQRIAANEALAAIYTLCTSRIEILDVGTLATQRKPRALGAEFDIPIATLELRWVYLSEI